MGSLNCHFLVGIPGSGKTTFAHQLRELIPHSIVISPDQIREQLFGAEIIQGDWQEISQCISHQIGEAVQSKSSIIYDATNIRASWRRDFLEEYSTLRLKWLCWHLSTPIKVCIHRNQSRSRNVPIDVIIQYAKYLNETPPTESEGFIRLVQVNPDSQDNFSRDELSSILATLD
ncbi:ATP-binding protein [Acaryochloris sp. IP29b_bin.137]|uniref:ATP-binding protein n=1 Tax=Acaryochloris sp. IP29b_bin.137 TaxID=2969217 RepID=UPI0026207D4C|nr:ATP-binding protein [Acaryochloris sp. IP29b_bin.137]